MESELLESSKLFAVLDVETTGSAPRDSKITEISIFLHDGEKIVNEFTTLVNPERSIPPFIQKFTGITNEMVAHSPTFPMIAKEIIEITDGATLVAHNSRFDYGMLKSEYNSLGFNFYRNTLCTVQLSRKYLPGHKSYSLGKLCKERNIPIVGRHRARGDAAATVTLFEQILNTSTQDILEKEVLIDAYNINLHPNIKKESIERLPSKTGVYYFYNEKEEIIYIGKSNSIRTRVLSHFSGEGTKKHLAMKNQVRDIDFEVMGSELIAMIHEASEIANVKPVYNHQYKRTSFNYGIYHYTNQDGYIIFLIDKIRAGSMPLTSSTGKRSAETILRSLMKEYMLCPKLCNLEKSKSTCFKYQLNKCLGACGKYESPQQYNARAEMALKRFTFKSSHFAIIEQGRSEGEKGVVLIKDGDFTGFGYVPDDLDINRVDNLDEWVKPMNSNRHILRIIQSYILQGKAKKMFSWSV